MHVSSKDSSRDGRTHLLTSVIEADGASELVKADERLGAELVSLKRTASGGIEIAVSIEVYAPVPTPALAELPEPKPPEPQPTDPAPPENEVIQ